MAPEKISALNELLDAIDKMGPDDRLSDVVSRNASLHTRLLILATGARDVQHRAISLRVLAESILASLPPEEPKQ